MFAIVEEPISLEDVTAEVADRGAGAIATFAGITRDTNRGRKVLRLEYDAYPDMAVSEFQKIADLASERWDLKKLAIVHRIGEVALGETSVAIAVSAVHRAEAIAACGFAIDRLKEVVPIWKKEYFEGGEVWIGSLADCAHDEEVSD